MKLRMKMLAILLLMFCFMIEIPVIANKTSLETVGDNIEKLEGQKETEKEEINILTQSQTLLYRELGDLDQKLSEIAINLTETEGRLEKLTSDLEILMKDREEVEAKGQEYYKNVKKRIKYLYENGDEHFLSLMLQAESFSDIWDRAIYISKVHEYDRNLLEDYKRISEDLRWKEDKLKQEQLEVELLARELKNQRIEAENLITRIKMSLINTEYRIEQAKQHESEYDTLINSQKEYEHKLELERQQEEAKRLEEIKRQQEEAKRHEALNGFRGGQVSNPIYNPVKNDLDLMAAIIECEADGESYEGKLAVGSVVINRINSPHFPNSLVEVLYENKQFTPVGSGRFAVVLARGANSNCYAAAQEVLAGKITLDSLFFRTNNGSKQGMVIGNHVFY